jgi:hypothetical protein
MPPKEIAAIVIQQLADHQAHNIEDVVKRTQAAAPADLYTSDIKSAVLGLVRRNELSLTDDFKVQLPDEQLVPVE